MIRNRLSLYPCFENQVIVNISVSSIYFAILHGRWTNMVHPEIETDPVEMRLFMETDIPNESERARWVQENYQAIDERIRFEMFIPLTWN